MRSQRQTHLATTTLHGHLDPVHAVAFSPHGERVAAGVGVVTKVWEASTCRQLLTLSGCGGGDSLGYPLELNTLLGREILNSVAYAVCYLRSETERVGLRMVVGSSAGSTVFLNGKRVHRCERRRLSTDNDTVPDIVLHAGLNAVVFRARRKVSGDPFASPMPQASLSMGSR